MARSISKNRIIRTLFTNLAPYYDQVEPALTWNQGVRWRQRAIAAARLSSPRRILDACSGTGLMTAPLAQAYGPRCHLIAIDFCPAMVGVAKQRLQDLGLQRRVEIKVENVEIMPFPDAFFDAVFVSFGLRFVSDIRTVLKEFHRVLKPGGRLVILELAKPSNPIQRFRAHIAREYLFPHQGLLVHKLPPALLHPLHDALIHFPDPEKLSRMLMRQDYDEVEYKPLKGGIATLHSALKLSNDAQFRFDEAQMPLNWSQLTSGAVSYTH